MMKYRVYGTVFGSKYLGEFEADSPEAAIELGLASEHNYVSICHQCTQSFDLADSSCSEGTAEAVEVEEER